MAITYTRLIYHAIWQVRGGAPIITAQYIFPVEMAITQQFIALGCHIQLLKSQLDHVHVLFEYAGEVGIPTIFKQVKGASSYHLNADGIVQESLYWEKGYDCFTVSPNKVNEVIAYLNDQLEYHKKTSYDEEMAILRKSAGLHK